MRRTLLTPRMIPIMVSPRLSLPGISSVVIVLPGNCRTEVFGSILLEMVSVKCHLVAIRIVELDGNWESMDWRIILRSNLCMSILEIVVRFDTWGKRERKRLSYTETRTR